MRLPAIPWLRQTGIMVLPITSVVRFDASGVDPAAEGRHLAPVTCWPLDGTLSGPLRYVVHAEMMD